MDKNVAALIVFDRQFGLRFLLIVFEACSPIVLQYSLLSMFSEGSPIYSDFVGLLAVSMYSILCYFAFRFIYNFLDIQQIKLLKARRLAASINPDRAADLSLNESIQKDKIVLGGQGKSITKVSPKKQAIIVGNPNAPV